MICTRRAQITVVSLESRVAIRLRTDIIVLSRERQPMKSRLFPEVPNAHSPAGAEIRYLMEGDTGNMIHSSVPPGQVNRATVHASVTEFWFVLSGKGEIWRRNESGEVTTLLESGVSLDIPVRTEFQYRCIGSEPLEFICVDMPPWPGAHEAAVVEGPWSPTVQIS